MDKILKVDSVDDYCRWIGTSSPHPLLAVINYAEVSPIRSSLNAYGVYGMFLQKNNPLELTYGCGKYDYKDSSLICVAPGQVGGREDDGSEVSIGGWGLLFHPDLIRGRRLEEDIKRCTFFNYSVNEALHMSADEYEHLECILMQIQDELQFQRDDRQDDILAGYLGLLMIYSARFYDRQFMTRQIQYSDLLTRFHDFLHEWIGSGKAAESGIPTVQMCADKLCMSPNYFSDLIKRLTGDSAGRRIRKFIIGCAKDSLAAGQSVAETAYQLGFEYPQHLTRMFKAYTGMAPTRYLASLKTVRTGGGV